MHVRLQDLHLSIKGRGHLLNSMIIRITASGFMPACLKWHTAWRAWESSAAVVTPRTGTPSEYVDIVPCKVGVDLCIYTRNAFHSECLGQQIGFGKLFPKNHLLFYSFILRYWAHYSFKGSPLFSNYSQLGTHLCAVLSCMQYKNDVKFLILVDLFR